jgi:8-amino-7-oxononanoate synthase
MFEQELSYLDQQGLLRKPVTIGPCQGPRVVMDGRSLLLMCSNDYLGLSGHPALRQAACEAMELYGFGSGASRLVSGTSPLHQELERKLAAFKSAEAAILFNSGYAANTGIIPAVAGDGDAIFSDSLNHASIIDGCRLSRAALHIYRHRDMNHLESLLKQIGAGGRRLIVTDGVFSMDGDIAPLPEIVTLSERYDALVMVDDAHATGVLGKNGTGTAEHFNLKDRVHIQMGTLGKAVGSFGAYAAGDRSLIDYLMNKARSFVYSTALPPAVCAASLAALDVMERENRRIARLWKNRRKFAEGLASLGLDTRPSETPIVPVMVGDARKTLEAGRRLCELGIYATGIRPPTVPEGTSRIRTTVMATHTDDDIALALDTFGRLKREGCF